MRSLLIHLLCRHLLGMNEAEVRAVSSAYPLIAQVGVFDGPRRTRRRRIEDAYAEAQRILRGGRSEKGRPEAHYALEMLIAAGAARRFPGGSVTQETSAKEGLRLLKVQYELELTKNMLGLPLADASQKIISPEVGRAGSGVHQNREDLLEYTESDSVGSRNGGGEG